MNGFLLYGIVGVIPVMTALHLLNSATLGVVFLAAQIISLTIGVTIDLTKYKGGQ